MPLIRKLGWRLFTVGGCFLVIATFPTWFPWINDQWTRFADQHVIPAIPGFIDRLLGG